MGDRLVASSKIIFINADQAKYTYKKIRSILIIVWASNISKYNNVRNFPVYFIPGQPLQNEPSWILKIPAIAYRYAMLCCLIPVGYSEIG